LHDALREWRREQAKAARVPAYTVFNDETLDDLVAQRPSSPGELLDVRGMGPVKVSRFGDEILAIVAADDGE
jgi:DNA helicase-2/ATP-dependent DNA helicase PcrA